MNENINKEAAKDKIFAILSFVVAYALIEGVLMNGVGLVSTICLIALYLFSTLFLVNQEIKPSVQYIVITAVEIITAISFSIFDNHFLKVIGILMLIVIYPVSIYFYNNKIKTLDQIFFFAVIKSIFIAPFMAFGKNIAIIFKTKSKNKNLLFALIGIGISIPLLIILIALLVSADAVFENLFNDIIEYIVDNFFEFIFKITISIPVALCIFSCLYCTKERKLDNILTDETCCAKSERVKKIPVITSFFVIIPVCIIYIIFFVAQLSYFTSALSGLLPDGYSYSEYARRGFFELCGISVINLILIAVISIFGNGKNKKINSVFSISLSLMSLAMVAISVSKMLLYIDAYGMTLPRIYTMWFLAFLTIVFILIILKQFINKIGVFICVCGLASVMLVGCIYSNPDGMIAKYNVNAYLTGKIDEIDIDALYELDRSAVKYVLPLTECEDKNVAEEAQNFINEKHREMLYDVNNWDNNVISNSAEKTLDSDSDNTLLIEAYYFLDDEIYSITCTVHDKDGNALATIGAENANGEEPCCDSTLYFEFSKNDIGSDIDDYYVSFDGYDKNGKIIFTDKKENVILSYGELNTVDIMYDKIYAE